MNRLNLNFNPLLLLSIFVVVLWSLLSPCHAQNNDFLAGNMNPDGAKTANSMSNPSAEFKNVNASADQSTVLLAANRTHRIDPSNKYEYYQGGWDITNQHYIVSLAYSGTPLFVIAVVWCFMVVICFTVLACCHCFGCRKNKSRTKYSEMAYAASLILMSIFLIMAIIGGLVLYIGQVKFMSTTTRVSYDLVAKAGAVVDVVHDIVTNLVAAKNIKVDRFVLPENIKQSIEHVESTSNQIATVKKQADDTAKKSKQLLKEIGRSLVTIGALMILLAIVGFGISIFGFKRVVYVLLFIGWILVTGTFILCGITFIVKNGIADTCAALDDWLKHPQAHTAISNLLPCTNEDTARETLDMTRNTTFQVVNLVNAFIVNIANADVPSSIKELYYNQSGPYVPQLCNPFLPNLTERACGPLEIELKGAPNAYENFLCNTAPTGECLTTGRLTPIRYQQITVATNLSDTLYRHGPFLASLVDCSFVTETVSEINKDECPLLKRYSRQVYIGLVLISVAVMFSVIMWVVFVRERIIQISSPNLSRKYTSQNLRRNSTSPNLIRNFTS